MIYYFFFCLIVGFFFAYRDLDSPAYLQALQAMSSAYPQMNLKTIRATLAISLFGMHIIFAPFVLIHRTFIALTTKQ
jgi:hypothetical protein